MKSRMNRICAGILAVLTVGCVLASCGDTAAVPKETENVPEKETGSVTDTAETEAYQPMPDLPVKDYGGHNFLIMTSSDKDDNGVDWVTKDVFVEKTTGDVITDAVFNRNMWLEDTFNVKISEYQCFTYSEIKKAVTAGVTDYDAVMTGINRGCTLGADGLVYDLKEIPYIDLTQSWWDQGVTAGTSIGGKVYIATGDITIVDNDATWTLMFNKKLANDMDYNFYQMVRDN